MAFNKETTEDLLNSTRESIKQSARKHQMLGDLRNISSLSSGVPRINPSVINKFRMIINQPEKLHAFNPFEIRCCLCNAVISYPAWYYYIQYSVNTVHFFICIDAESPNKPSTKCYRRKDNDT